MAIFTVHLPRGEFPGTAPGMTELARAVFVPEGFSWRAFIFGPLWLLSRGLWLAFIVWLAAIVALSILAALYLTPTAAGVIFVAIELYLGLEGNALRRAKLKWRGYRCVDVVAGGQRDAAERTFFARFFTAKASPPPPVQAPPRQPPGPPADPHGDVLGHFPVPGGRA
jgi:hypothetical protein